MTTHRHPKWHDRRDHWQRRDAWYKFCVGWEFTAIVILRWEYNT